MIGEPEPRKVGRIVHKLLVASKQEPTPERAEWFFRNFVRVQRLIQKREEQRKATSV